MGNTLAYLSKFYETGRGEPLSLNETLEPGTLRGGKVATLAELDATLKEWGVGDESGTWSANQLNDYLKASFSSAGDDSDAQQSRWTVVSTFPEGRQVRTAFQQAVSSAGIVSRSADMNFSLKKAGDRAGYMPSWFSDLHQTYGGK